MTNIVVIISFILALVGVSVVVWSIADTRRKHYDDYIRRKRND